MYSESYCAWKGILVRRIPGVLTAMLTGGRFEPDTSLLENTTYRTSNGIAVEMS